MISDAELLAGLAFLQIHSHPAHHAALKMALSACNAVHQDRKRDEVRVRAASDLEVSVRTGCALQDLGIKTVGDLERLLNDPAEENLLSSREAKKAGFGKRVLKECREVLKNVGIEPKRH